MAAATDAAKLAPAARLERLGDVLLAPTPAPINGIAIEALLDAFLVLFDECSYSELKREKIVADFVKECKPVSRAAWYAVPAHDSLPSCTCGLA